MRRNCAASSLERLFDRSTTIDISQLPSTVGAVIDRAYFVDSRKTARSLLQASRYRACALRTAPTIRFLILCANPPERYAQISASVGTFLSLITLPIRETFMRCL